MFRAETVKEFEVIELPQMRTRARGEISRVARDITFTPRSIWHLKHAGAERGLTTTDGGSCSGIALEKTRVEVR